jgi:hypothetical protein
LTETVALLEGHSQSPEKELSEPTP